MRNTLTPRHAAALGVPVAATKPAEGRKTPRKAKARQTRTSRDCGPSERDIQAACMAWLTFRGVWHVRVNSGGIMVGKCFVKLGTAGTPDVLACVRHPETGVGHFVGIEIKSAVGKLRPAQAVALDAIRAAGGLGVVVRSVGELEQALKLEGLL